MGTNRTKDAINHVFPSNGPPPRSFAGTNGLEAHCDVSMESQTLESHTIEGFAGEDDVHMKESVPERRNQIFPEQNELPYYDPRSWVWKGKPNATFAVVIDEPRKPSGAHSIKESMSSPKIRPGTLVKVSDSGSRKVMDWLNVTGLHRPHKTSCKGSFLFLSVIFHSFKVMWPLNSKNAGESLEVTL